LPQACDPRKDHERQRKRKGGSWMLPPNTIRKIIVSFRGDANGSAQSAADDRLRIEPGIQGFPDVQLHICGLVLRTIPE
jgi:hypothetical protein